MNSTANLPSHGTPLDPDLAEQARPGHGVPSQDPDSAAQFPIDPADAEREAHSVLAAGGAVGGVAIGAAIGAVVGGPVGIVVGGSLGAVAGALGGVAAGAVTNPGDSHDADPLIKEGVPARTK
jgi:hypothetical protein